LTGNYNCRCQGIINVVNHVGRIVNYLSKYHNLVIGVSILLELQPNIYAKSDPYASLNNIEKSPIVITGLFLI
ncbi:MAG: hypothetical protein ACP5FZ_08125, partial [Fidelibacterota bacterium]